MSDESIERQPGFNPNLKNMKGRKKFRSGRKNSSPDSAPSTSFVDPLPEPVVFQKEISDLPRPGHLVVGYVEIDPFQIDLVANLFADISTAVRDRLAQRIQFPVVGDMARSTFHMCVASQLYSTMSLLSDNSGDLYRFKSLQNLNIEVPKFVSALTQQFGHFESKEGIISLKYIQSLMLREVAKGLAYTTTIFNNVSTGLSIQDCNNYYFKSGDFTDMLNGRCSEIIERYSGINFTVNIGGNPVRTRLPNFDPRDKGGYHNAINALVPLVDQPAIHAACASYDLSFNEFNEPGRARDRTELNLILCPMNIPELNNKVGEYGVAYSLGFANTFSQLFDVGPIITSDRGSAAQTVAADGVGRPGFEASGNHSYAISESNAAFGYVMMPNKSFTFEPKRVTTSNKNRFQILNEFAQSNLAKA